jgi:cation:H+ antiporter
LLTVALLAGGFVLLIAGAELLVRGASRLAFAAGVSPLVVGLTVVSLGTSSPEIAVSIGSALEGEGDLTLGNVVGSNICNVLLILGASALIVPLIVSLRLIRIHVPLMVGVSALLIVLSLDGSLSRFDGLLLTGGLLAYIVFTVIEGRRESPSAAREAAPATTPAAVNVVFLLAGLAMLAIGAQVLVDSATEIAIDLGVSSLIVGLTLVALGTSLPEIATSILAAVRGERDLAVGNVVGSNVFNVLGVMGISSLVSPEALSVSAAAIRFDLPVMLAVAIACLPIFFTGRLVARWEGALFVAYYGAYLLYLALDATQHDALEPYSTVMLVFVLPLTALTLGAGALYEYQRVRIRWMLRRSRRRM